MNDDMTLDIARDMFRDAPSEVTAANYESVAREYCDDGIIEDDTLARIQAECEPYLWRRV